MLVMLRLSCRGSLNNTTISIIIRFDGELLIDNLASEQNQLDDALQQCHPFLTALHPQHKSRHPKHLLGTHPNTPFRPTTTHENSHPLGVPQPLGQAHNETPPHSVPNTILHISALPLVRQVRKETLLCSQDGDIMCVKREGWYASAI